MVSCLGWLSVATQRRSGGTADALRSGRSARNGRGGSNPPFGTNTRYRQGPTGPFSRARSSVRIERSPAEAEVVGSSPTERATFLCIMVGEPDVKIEANATGWFVYALRNDKARRYVGWTGRTPKQRLTEHNAGLNAWTRAHGPWRLVYFEKHGSKQAAIRRERYFKTGAGRRELDRLLAPREGKDEGRQSG